MRRENDRKQFHVADAHMVFSCVCVWIVWGREYCAQNIIMFAVSLFLVFTSTPSSNYLIALYGTYTFVNNDANADDDNVDEWLSHFCIFFFQLRSYRIVHRTSEGSFFFFSSFAFPLFLLLFSSFSSYPFCTTYSDGEIMRKFTKSQSTEWTTPTTTTKKKEYRICSTAQQQTKYKTEAEFGDKRVRVATAT